jgi:HlyD family secretion protein
VNTTTTRIILAVLGLTGIGFTAAALFGDDDALVYTQATVTRGEIESVVMTSGTLEAMNTVIVGSQLSGQIAAIYADFNQAVEKDALIARIDPRTFEARVAQNRAEVQVAEATIAQRQAELSRAQVTLGQAERELARRQSLKERGHLSDSELDADLTNVATNRAGVAIAMAAVVNAEAALAQKQSALQQSELDLERTEIRAPIAGTIVNRTVQQGQTVAASLQAPELFQIAEDLRYMKVEASVDEADIGRIREGMTCRFTVDAHPDRVFQGKVTQVRVAPDRLLNVVTYRVIIETDNRDRTLLPGMTANVEVILGTRADVLRVPSAALRFVPQDPGAIPVVATPGAAVADGSVADEPTRGAVVWMLDGRHPTARAVVIGLSDDSSTEVLQGLTEGDQVIVRANEVEPG